MLVSPYRLRLMAMASDIWSGNWFLELCSAMIHAFGLSILWRCNSLMMSSHGSMSYGGSAKTRSKDLSASRLSARIASVWWVDARSSMPRAAISSLIFAARLRSISTKSTRSAPWSNRSKPTAPVPAYRSSAAIPFAPSGPSIEMIAERVLDDVGRSPCFDLRFFLSACFNSELRHANPWLYTTKSASALTTIMRNRLMHVSTSRGAIYRVSSDR